MLISLYVYVILPAELFSAAKTASALTCEYTPIAHSQTHRVPFESHGLQSSTQQKVPCVEAFLLKRK